MNKLYRTETHQISLQTECKHIINAHYSPFYLPIQLIYQGLFSCTHLLECKPQIHLPLQNDAHQRRWCDLVWFLTYQQLYATEAELKPRKRGSYFHYKSRTYIKLIFLRCSAVSLHMRMPEDIMAVLI